jgi:hypothetical protein
MIQRANHRFRADRSDVRRLNGPRPGTILVQSKVSPRLVIVGEVIPQNPPKMPLAYIFGLLTGRPANLHTEFLEAKKNVTIRCSNSFQGVDEHSFVANPDTSVRRRSNGDTQD